MTEDFVSVIARSIAPRISSVTMPPSKVFDEIDIGIRKGIAEYRRRSNEPDRLHARWIQGFLFGAGSVLVAVTIGAVIGSQLVK